MRKRRLRGVFALATLGLGISLLATACGDSGGSGTAAAGPDATATSGSIVISGLVDYPMTLVAYDTDYMDWATVTAEDPDLGTTSYDGVWLSEVFTYVGVQPDAKTVVVSGYDSSSVRLALADIDQDALLALWSDDSFDLVIPGAGSDSWVKDVVGMVFE